MQNKRHHSIGQEGGAGNIVIAEVLCIHVDENVLNEDDTMIDQTKLAHVARLGGDWYCRVTEDTLFTVAKPNIHPGIGLDALPKFISSSEVLTGNDLAQLANVTQIPSKYPLFYDERLATGKSERQALHHYVQQLLSKNEVDKAWQVLLQCEDESLQ